MTWDGRAGAAVGRLEVVGRAAVLGAIALVLCAPGLALAWNAQCTEIWNPHGETIPPAGRTTSPGTSPNSGQNPDGFYQVGAAIDSLVAPVWLIDGCGDGFTDFIYDGDPETEGIQPFSFGTVIKYTEANGKTPDQENMATSKFGPSYDGSSDWVEWHLWGQGDLLVCDAGVDPFTISPPTSEEDKVAPRCICCYVPPPPRDCEPPDFEGCPVSTGPLDPNPGD
jgi:hypothetical protein